MKVADIVRLLDTKSEVFVYTEESYLDCMMGKDSWDCPEADEEIGCGCCDYCLPRTDEWESYHGRGELVPIKLGDKKVLELNVRVRTLGKGRKRNDYPCLGVKVEADNAGA